jgi:hypothetical protein
MMRRRIHQKRRRRRRKSQHRHRRSLQLLALRVILEPVRLLFL